MGEKATGRRGDKQRFGRSHIWGESTDSTYGTYETRVTDLLISPHESHKSHPLTAPQTYNTERAVSPYRPFALIPAVALPRATWPFLRAREGRPQIL